MSRLTIGVRVVHVAPEESRMDKKRRRRSRRPDTYIVDGPDDGPQWECLQALEDEYRYRKDVEDRNSRECPQGHRNGVTLTRIASPKGATV